MSGAAWDRPLLDTIWQAQSQEPLALLLVRDMALIAESDGRAPLVTLATRFRNFFRKRRAEGKAELAHEIVPAVVSPSIPGEWTVEWWIETILTRALTGLNSELMRRDGDYIAWKAELWSRWSPGFRKALRNVAEARLIEHFDTRVQGGW